MDGMDWKWQRRGLDLRAVIFGGDMSDTDVNRKC